MSPDIRPSKPSEESRPLRISRNEWDPGDITLALRAADSIGGDLQIISPYNLHLSKGPVEILLPNGAMEIVKIGMFLLPAKTQDAPTVIVTQVELDDPGTYILEVPQLEITMNRLVGREEKIVERVAEGLYYVKA